MRDGRWGVRLLVFHLKKVVNDFALAKVLIFLGAVLFIFFLFGFFYFLYPLSCELYRGAKQKNIFNASVLPGRLPKQVLAPRGVSDMHAEVASMLKKNKIDDYEIRVAGLKALKGNCFYGVDVQASLSFKNHIGLMKFLTKREFFLESISLENSGGQKLRLSLKLLGFCGEFCVCNT